MNSSMAEARSVAVSEAQKAYLTKVYGWMVGGLFTTALIGGIIVSDQQIMMVVLSYRWILILAQFGLVIALSGFIEKMNTITAMGSFLLYSALNGLTLSALLLIYSETAIVTSFLSSAGMFGAMSLYGTITKKDLSGIGSFMFMGLIGIILASIVNMFLGSDALSFAISIIGVLVFTGLTAYDTQKIKESAELEFHGSEIATKGAILGALTLYLDFINLFIFTLRLLGGRRD
jgi:hypothetical protein